MARTMTWLEARSLGDLGICVAHRLNGQLGEMPIAAAQEPISEETARLVSLLAGLNRSGMFITVNSQPACTPDRRIGLRPWQRAAVMGFVPSWESILRLRCLSERREVLHLKVKLPGATSEPANIPVSCNTDVTPVTWFGEILSRADIARNYGGVTGDSDRPGLDPTIIRQLQQCYQVTIIDKWWGQNDTLWPELGRLL
jgi:hypothetical protein